MKYLQKLPKDSSDKLPLLTKSFEPKKNLRKKNVRHKHCEKHMKKLAVKIVLSRNKIYYFSHSEPHAFYKFYFFFPLLYKKKSGEKKSTSVRLISSQQKQRLQ